MRGCFDLLRKTAGYRQFIGMQPSHASTPPQKIRAAAEQAFFREVLPYFWHALSRLGVPEAEREELAQEIMIAVYAKLHEYDPRRATPAQWCRAFVLNIGRNHLRKKQAGLGPLEELTPDLVDERPGPEDRYMAQIHHRLLHEVLLPQVDFEERVVVIAVDLEELDVKTVAEQDNIPLSTVYARLKRGRKQLQDAYDRHQLQQKAQGLLVMPFALEHLLEADRTIPPVSPEVVNRTWRQVQRARRAPALAGAPSSAARLGPGLGSSLPRGRVRRRGPLVALPIAAVRRRHAARSGQVRAAGCARHLSAKCAASRCSRSLHNAGEKRLTSNLQERAADFEFASQAFELGKYDDALAALLAHERNFPTGPFASERKLLRAQIAALRDAGGSAPKVEPVSTIEP